NRRQFEQKSYEVRVDHARMSRDQVVFLAVFVVKVVLGLFAFVIKPWLGVLFLAGKRSLGDVLQSATNTV
ncbi:MAG: hypothetical protein RL235_430, partial [Chlamydiota bacterium]